MAKTISFAKGKGNIRHNNRDFISENIDKTRIKDNIVYVQQPLIQAVVDHLLGKSTCSCDGESATLTNWVMDKILNKI